GRVVATPLSRALALLETKGYHPEPSKEPTDGHLLAAASAAPELFDVDRTHVGRFRYGPKCAKPIGSSLSAKCVDQNCCVEKERRHVLADTASIGTSLVADPRRGIGVPLVSGVSDLSERGHDVVPSA